MFSGHTSTGYRELLRLDGAATPRWIENRKFMVAEGTAMSQANYSSAQAARQRRSRKPRSS